MRVALGCKSIDDLLGGGFEGGCISLIFGEAGSGKTNICLQLSRNVVQAGKKVIYIDTEGVSMERLAQICGEDFEVVAKNVLFSEPYSFDEQEVLIEKAVRITETTSEVGLIVIDSATMHYRLTQREEARRDDLHMLNRQIAKLVKVSRKVGIPVIATSQVYTDIETGRFLPLGGHMLTHSAKTILEVSKVGPSARLARIVKHRSAEENRTARFRLTMSGVED